MGISRGVEYRDSRSTSAINGLDLRLARLRTIKKGQNLDYRFAMNASIYLTHSFAFSAFFMEISISAV